MRKMTQTERIRSYILKSIVIISAVVGTILSALNRTGEFIVGNCYLSIAERLEGKITQNRIKRPCSLRRSAG